MSNPKKRAAEPAAPAKTTKKRKTKAQQDDELLDMDLGVNTLFARMDNQLLADHLAQKLTRFGGDLSSVELSDLTVSGEQRLPRKLPNEGTLANRLLQQTQYVTQRSGRRRGRSITCPASWRSLQRIPQAWARRPRRKARRTRSLSQAQA